MYFAAATARNHLRSAIACLLLGWLILLAHSTIHFTPIYTMLVPVAPLWLSLRALHRGDYPPAVGCAWVGAGACGLVSAYWGVVTEPGLFSLVGLIFAAMAGSQLRRL